MLFAVCYIWMWNTSVCLRKWFTIPLQDELCIYLAAWLLYNHLCFCMPLSSCLPISMPAFSFICQYICQSAWLSISTCLYNLSVFLSLPVCLPRAVFHSHSVLTLDVLLIHKSCVCVQGRRSGCAMWQDAEPSLQKEPGPAGGAADPGSGGSRRCLHRAQDAGAGLLAQDQGRQRLDTVAFLCCQGQGAMRPRLPRARR